MLILTSADAPFNVLKHPDINPSPGVDNADAINELLSTKTRLYFPAGTYEIDTALDVSKATRIYGVPGATTIKATTAMTQCVAFTRQGAVWRGIDLNVNSLTTNGFRFSNVGGTIAVTAVTGAPTSNAVYAVGADGHDITFYQLAGSTALGDNEVYCDNGEFGVVTFSDCDVTALVKANPSVVKVNALNSRFQNGNKMGLELLQNSDSERIAAFTSDSCVYSGNAFNAECSITSNNVLMEDDTITGGIASGYALELVKCDGFTLNRETINCGASVGRGISAVTCTQGRVNDHVSSGSTGGHIVYQSCEDIITDNGTFTGGTGYGITHNNQTTNYDVTNCTFNGQSTMKKGLWHNHSGDVADITIDSNDFHDCTEHAELWTTSAITVTNYTRTNNTYDNTNAGFGDDPDITYVNKVESNNG